MSGAFEVVEHIYATLSLYAKSDSEIRAVRELIGLEPDKQAASRDGGLFSLHFTTDGSVASLDAEEHVLCLVERLQPLLKAKDGLAGLLSEATLWIYVEPAELNSGFRLSPTVIAWLRDIGADVRVDIWDRATPDPE